MKFDQQRRIEKSEKAKKEKKKKEKKTNSRSTTGRIEGLVGECGQVNELATLVDVACRSPGFLSQI
jgi:hypothetical protein